MKEIELFLPNEYVKNMFHIQPEDLKNRGIKGVITDLDNTLIEWDRPNATPQLEEWFANMKEHDIQVTVVSNNNEQRVKDFADPLGIPFIHSARKPFVRAFKRAIAKMNLQSDEAVVIGDQVINGVLGGNRVGLHTILVVPVAKTDGFVTRFNRKIERRIMSNMKKKGLINWEE